MLPYQTSILCTSKLQLALLALKQLGLTSLPSGALYIQPSCSSNTRPVVILAAPIIVLGNLMENLSNMDKPQLRHRLHIIFLYISLLREMGSFAKGRTTVGDIDPPSARSSMDWSTKLSSNTSCVHGFLLRKAHMDLHSWYPARRLASPRRPARQYAQHAQHPNPPTTPMTACVSYIWNLQSDK
jgi:hypothetical protein